MGAANQVPGAINHYVIFSQAVPATGTAAGTYYLGTAVLAPEPEEEKAFLPVLNDLGGRSVPFQKVYDGQEGAILTTLNRFDYTIYKAMRACVNQSAAVIGQDGPVDRGTLVLGTGRDFGFVLQYVYFNQPILAPSQPDMPAGRFYYSCTLEKVKESTVGSRIMEIALAVRWNNLFQLAGANARGFNGYTETLPTLPTPN